MAPGLFQPLAGLLGGALSQNHGDGGFGVAIGLGNGLLQCVSWSLMADAMDYGEYKFGKREEGTTYAMHSFFRKLAQGIGPSIGLAVAGMLGYASELGANQTAQTALNMRYQFAAFYLLGAAISLVGLALVYNLDKKTMAKITEALHKKHAGGKA